MREWERVRETARRASLRVVQLGGEIVAKKQPQERPIEVLSGHTSPGNFLPISHRSTPACRVETTAQGGGGLPHDPLGVTQCRGRLVLALHRVLLRTPSSTPIQRKKGVRCLAHVCVTSATNKHGYGPVPHAFLLGLDTLPIRKIVWAGHPFVLLVALTRLRDGLVGVREGVSELACSCWHASLFQATATCLATRAQAPLVLPLLTRPKTGLACLACCTRWPKSWTFRPHLGPHRPRPLLGMALRLPSVLSALA